MTAKVGRSIFVLMSATDPRSERLSELSQCAYRLGMAFGAEAQRAEETARKLEYFELFERCFFAVRVATALELRLRRARGPDREALSDRERPDTERTECDRDYDADRDRESEREREGASIPILLRTLGSVAADAAALPGREPAALPALRELLAQVTLAPQPAGARSPAAGALRTRLAGSATVPILISTAPARSGLRLPAALRHATGPPPR